MLRKIVKVCVHKDMPTWAFMICIIITLSFVFTFGYIDLVEPCLSYPEEEYQMLESEAQRIIAEKTLDTEVKHSIQYENDIESKNFELTLKGDRISVSISVDDFGGDNQSLSVTRDYTNAFDYKLTNIFTIIMMSLMFGFLCGLIVFLVLTMIGFICDLIDSILYKIRKRKLKKSSEEV